MDTFQDKLKEIGDKLLDKLLAKTDEIHQCGPNELSFFLTVLKEASAFCFAVDSYNTRLERLEEPWSHNKE